MVIWFQIPFLSRDIGKSLSRRKLQAKFQKQKMLFLACLLTTRIYKYHIWMEVINYYLISALE